MSHRNLFFRLPGGASGVLQLDFSLWNTMPENINDKDITDSLQADLPKTNFQLTGTVRFTEDSFTMDYHAAYYHFRWTADFRTSTIQILQLNVIKEEQGKGIGLSVFAHLLNWSRRFGFTQIELYAEGGWIGAQKMRWHTLSKNGIRQTPEQIGYYAWGRYGFEMFPRYTAIFQSWNNYFQCSNPDFPELLMTEDDRQKWKELGFSWRGKFSLEAKSNNSKNWKEYAGQRKLSQP